MSKQRKFFRGDDYQVVPDGNGQENEKQGTGTERWLVGGNVGNVCASTRVFVRVRVSEKAESKVRCTKPF
jgi:hypothetical protein